MQKSFFLLLVAFFLGTGAYAQCEFCNPPEGRTVDFCYTDQELSGFCAMFKENLKHFYFENANRKKSKVIEVALPKDMKTPPSIPYLSIIGSNKSYKLTTQEVLFIGQAIRQWQAVEALRTWNEAELSSGYTLTNSGLAYKVIQMGTGPVPTTGQKPKVHYTGYLLDGKKFDSSRDRKSPFSFELGRGQVIKGWDQGVALMPTGSRFLFRIPADLAYGSREIPNVIPANSTLIFDVELIEVK